MSQKINYVEANPSKRQECEKVKLIISEEVTGMPSGNISFNERGKTQPKMNNISGGSSLPPRKRSLFSESGSPSGSQERNNKNKNPNNAVPYATARFAWKGSFMVNDPCGTKQVEMLAYFSRKIQIEVSEIVSTLPAKLEMRVFQCSSAWTKKFDQEPPMIDDIGFYFFPQDENHHKKYRNIIRYLDSKSYVLKFILGRNIELRVFSSQMLQPQFQSINGSTFLWGLIVKCKKKKHQKRRKSATKQKSLSEFYSQNTPTKRSEAASSCFEEMPKTPIAVDKGAQSSNICVKKEMDFTDLPPGFGGILTVQKTPLTSKESVPVVSATASESSRRSEPKQKQSKNDSESLGLMFSHVGIEQLRRALREAQNRAQSTTQDVGQSKACSEKTTGDAPEPDHSETNVEKTDRNSESARKNVVVKQEIDPINYTKNQVIGQASAPVGPVVLAEPSRRSASQEEREDSSSPAPTNSKIRAPDLPPDSAGRHVETGGGEVTNESSPKLQETNVEQSSLQSKQLEIPITSTPKVAEVRATTKKSSDNERTSSVGTSSNSARQEPVPPQLETPVAAPNTVEVKREAEPVAGIRFALKPPESSRRQFSLFSNWRSPFTLAPSSIPHPQLPDYKPPIGPRFENQHLFNPSCPPAQNLRPQIRPRTGDHQYMNQFQVPLLPSPQDLRPQIRPTNGDQHYLNQNLRPQIGPTNGDQLLNQHLRPQIRPKNGDQLLNQGYRPQISPTNGDQQFLNQQLRPQIRPQNGEQQYLNQNLRPQVHPTNGDLHYLNQDLRPPVRPSKGDLQYINQFQAPFGSFPQALRPPNGDLQLATPRASAYHWANLTGPSPCVRVFSNPSLIPNEGNNANRSYPLLPKLEPCDCRVGEAEGSSSRRPSREDDNRADTVILRRPSGEDNNNNRGDLVIVRRLRSPVRRWDRRSLVRRRSKSPVRNRRRERSRSYSPMSSSSLSPIRGRDWRRRSPSRSPPRRRWRSRGDRRNRRRSRSLARYMRSNCPSRNRNRSPVENRASSRSVSPQAGSDSSPGKSGTN